MERAGISRVETRAHPGPGSRRHPHGSPRHIVIVAAGGADKSVPAWRNLTASQVQLNILEGKNPEVDPAGGAGRPEQAGQRVAFRRAMRKRAVGHERPAPRHSGGSAPVVWVARDVAIGVLPRGSVRCTRCRAGHRLRFFEAAPPRRIGVKVWIYKARLSGHAQRARGRSSAPRGRGSAPSRWRRRWRWRSSGPVVRPAAPTVATTVAVEAPRRVPRPGRGSANHRAHGAVAGELSHADSSARQAP